MGRFRWLTLNLCRDWRNWRAAVSCPSRRVSGDSPPSQSRAADLHTISSRLCPVSPTFSSCLYLFPSLQENTKLYSPLPWTPAPLDSPSTPILFLGMVMVTRWETGKTYPTLVLVLYCGPRNSEIVFNHPIFPRAWTPMVSYAGINAAFCCLRSTNCVDTAENKGLSIYLVD